MADNILYTILSVISFLYVFSVEYAIIEQTT